MTFNREPGKRSIIIGPGLPIEIDSLESENHSSIVRYTRYPVESGRFSSDHAQELPDEVELNIIATDTPMQADSFEGRHRTIYTQLRLWEKLKVPLILVLGLRSYINMHIEELNSSKQPRDGKSIKMNIKFIEIQEASVGLGALGVALLIDSGIVHSATELVPIGLI